MVSCTVSLPNSPVFSPSRATLFSKTAVSSSPEKTLLSPSAATSPLPSSPSSSPFRLRLQKPPVGLNRSFADCYGSALSSSPPTLLKRKRPARLDIPIASLGIAGGGLATPRTVIVERREEDEEEGDGYSVYCKRGKREVMEDRFSAAVDLQGDPKQAIFGVFDGHGGAKAAEFAAENLHRNILHEIERSDKEEIEDAIKFGFLNTDSDFLKEDLRGGTCCVTALLRHGNIMVSNAGDCRAVVSRGGVAEALTSDHRPSREDEKTRIEDLGGYVDCCHGIWRIQGTLAVSRGIGDRHLKQWITAAPETKTLRIEPDLEFLILASDGLWDKVTNQEAVDIARPLCAGDENPELLSACKKLATLAASRGSYDDISVMVIRLERFQDD
ncbi:Phosphoprotein phosphatase [Bertholletia excelsa]